MGFAPRSGGEVRPYSFELKHPERIIVPDEAYGAVINAAIDFWDSVAQDDRISDEFKNYLSLGNPVKLIK
jgi:hypothetical protein